MRIVLALAMGLILVGCGGPGDTPGPSSSPKENKAMDPQAADDALKNAPPDVREKAMAARAAAAKGEGGGPPPKK